MLICNKAAYTLLGLTEDQLLGRSSFDSSWNVIHEDGTDFPGNTHPVPTAVKTRQPVRDIVMGVYRPVTKDRVWLLVNADPILDEKNEIIHVICTFTDITEQKRLSQQLVEQEIQKQKQITQATIDGQEKERREIGKELHDNINQHITTTRLYLEVGEEKANGEIKEMIQRARKELAAIFNVVRNLSQSLVPPTLGDIGLIESVKDICNSLKVTHKFNVHFNYHSFSEEVLPDNMKLMLFRIIQEQINNIVRHSAADTIRIRLIADAEAAELRINDNGKGVDLSQGRKGLGLTNITNRAELFNGKVDIKTAPGEGFILTVSVPLK
jgi:PAS domain S-box-containing protein